MKMNGIAWGCGWGAAEFVTAVLAWLCAHPASELRLPQGLTRHVAPPASRESAPAGRFLGALASMADLPPPPIASASAGSLAMPSTGGLQCCFPAGSAARCGHATAIGFYHFGDIGHRDRAGQMHPRDQHAGPRCPTCHGTAALVQPDHTARRGRRVCCCGPVRFPSPRACLSPSRPPPLICGCSKTRCG